MPSSRSYDARGVMESQTLLVDTQLFGFDAAGRISSIQDGGPAPGFDYSGLVSGNAAFSDTYTLNSNRLASTSGPVAKVCKRSTNHVLA